MEFCFLDLLLSLPASAIAGEDAGSVFQQLPFPGPYQVGMKISCSLDNWLIVLLPSSASSATRNLKAAVCHRRFLTIVLALHRHGELLHYTL